MREKPTIRTIGLAILRVPAYYTIMEAPLFHLENLYDFNFIVIAAVNKVDRYVVVVVVAVVAIRRSRMRLLTCYRRAFLHYIPFSKTIRFHLPLSTTCLRWLLL